MHGTDSNAVQVRAEAVSTRELAWYLVVCVLAPVVIVGVALARDGAFTHTSLPPGANLFRGDFTLSTAGAVPISNVSVFAGYDDPHVPGATGLIVRAAGPGTTELGFVNLDGVTRISVAEGRSYTFSAVLFDVAAPGSPLGLGIEWFDHRGNLIADDSKPPDPIPPRPTHFTRTVTAPSGAASAIPFARYTAPAANQAFGVGSVQFKEVLNPPSG